MFDIQCLNFYGVKIMKKICLRLKKWFNFAKIFFLSRKYLLT